MEGFQLKHRYVVKQITFTMLNGSAYTYAVGTCAQHFTSEEFRTMDFITSHLHGISLSRGGCTRDELQDRIREYCGGAIVVTNTIVNERFLKSFDVLNSQQIVTLQRGGRFAFPSTIVAYCGSWESEHKARYCTKCKGDYILHEATYEQILKSI